MSYDDEDDQSDHLYEAYDVIHEILGARTAEHTLRWYHSTNKGNPAMSPGEDASCVYDDQLVLDIAKACSDFKLRLADYQAPPTRTA